MLLINSFYEFQGSGRPLGEYRFLSTLLAGDSHSGARNRFHGGWFHWLPVPLPEAYVLGIDRQISEFEHHRGAYLFGKYLTGGRWYWHPVALAVKEPTGTLLLGGLAVILVWRLRAGPRLAVVTAGCAALPLAVALVVTLGANGHLRYALPVLPLFYVAVAVVAASGGRWANLWVGCCLVLNAAELGNAWPHPESFFNTASRLLAPKWPPLGGDSLDPGMDYWYLHDWYEREGRPEPIYALCKGGISLTRFGLPSSADEPVPLTLGGWYVISARAEPDFPTLAARIRAAGRCVDRIGACLEVWRVPPPKPPPDAGIPLR